MNQSAWQDMEHHDGHILFVTCIVWGICRQSGDNINGISVLLDEWYEGVSCRMLVHNYV